MQQEASVQQPEANVPQEANEQVGNSIDKKWWYFLSRYSLVQKRFILFTYVIGIITEALGKLIPGKRLPERICIGVFGLTSSGKSSTINTCLQHQEEGTTTRQSIAAEGDGISGVKTLRPGLYPILDSKAQFIDTRGFNVGVLTKADEDELAKLGLGKLADVQRAIYRKNDKQAPQTLVDSSAKNYSLIHVPLVCLAANASTEQEAVVTSIVTSLKQLGFSHIVLVITKKSLNVARAEEIKRTGFAGIPSEDIYFIDNKPSDEVKADPKAYKQFLREQEEQALDIMLACITKAEFNGLYNVPVVNAWALMKQYYGTVQDKLRAYDVKFSLSTLFLSVLLFSVLYLLRKLVS